MFGGPSGKNKEELMRTIELSNSAEGGVILWEGLAVEFLNRIQRQD
jgi:ABC-type iron transport system FetAB ATPase subunit